MSSVYIKDANIKNIIIIRIEIYNFYVKYINQIYLYLSKQINLID